MNWIEVNPIMERVNEREAQILISSSLNFNILLFIPVSALRKSIRR
jgi:hypothetical protein